MWTKHWKTVVAVAAITAIGASIGPVSAEPPVGGCGDIVHGKIDNTDWHGGPGDGFLATWFISNFSNTHVDDRKGIANSATSGETSNPSTHANNCGA